MCQGFPCTSSLRAEGKKITCKNPTQSQELG
jgi:hypothetical protein